MTIPSQRILAGRLDSAYAEAREAAARNDAIHKIWDRRAELWKPDAAHARVILNRLGWIPVLDAMRAAVAGLQQFAAEVHRAGLRHTVLLGMGGSSLAPEVFSLVFPSTGDGQFIVLDSTDPAAVLAVERAVDLRETLFLVASKSGKTIETLSQFSYFHERLCGLSGAAAGEHFVAITDAGSQLERLAQEHGFRRTFLNPADIGGRYSALSYFGLVPAALWGVDIAAVFDGAMAMREACGPGAKAGNNPALALGVLLGIAARGGADKMILLGSEHSYVIDLHALGTTGTYSPFESYSFGVSGR